MRAPDRRLLAAGGVARRATFVAIAIGVAGALLAIAQAALLARIIAGVVEQGDGPSTVAVPMALLGVVLLVRAGMAWSSEVAAQRISGRVKSDLRLRLLGRTVQAGTGPEVVATGDIALLATHGLDALDAWFARVVPQAALAGIVPVAVVVCLVMVDPIAGVTVALTVPLIPVFMVLIGRMSAAHRARRWASLAVLAHRFMDVVAGLPTLRGFGRAELQVGTLRRVTDAWRASTMATLRIAFLSALALEMLATISVALVAVEVGLRLDAGMLTLQTGLFAIVLAPEAYLPLRRLGAEFHASEEGLAAARSAFAVIDAPLPQPGPGRPAPDRPRSIRVDGLSVAQPGRDILAPASVTLRAVPGQILALLGPSGAGKSTLLHVLLGLRAASAGRVVIERADGTTDDLGDLDTATWRRAVAWVPQVPFLVAGTVADNIRLSVPDATDRAIGAALEAVGLMSVDPAMRLGEGGAGLSSGQRRRIGVARALLRDAPVLLLDEPTAGLDGAAESAVLEAIRAAAARDAIVILVAHRPAALAIADRQVRVDWREWPAPPATPSPGPGSAATTVPVTA